MSPHYDYYCSDCKVTQEEFFSMIAKPDFITCTSCGSKAKSVISGNEAFHLKGHGWGFDRYAGPSNFSGGDDD